jgi:AraC family transcriptional regulator, L-arginine-responsive activator
MSLANLARPGRDQPLRMLLVNAGDAESLTWSGLVNPLRLAQRLLGEAFVLEVRTPGSLPAGGEWHLALLAADEQQAAPPPAVLQAALECCRRAACWGGVGAAALWLARAGHAAGVRIALPWALYGDADETTERAILTQHLYEIDGRILTCCGGAASIDFAVMLLEQLFGGGTCAAVKEALCIDRVRGAEERQRVALQARFGALQPKLSEAVTLMEANIEEPLSTDDIAQLVGLSRRQLERLFKQYLGSLPSRYYLELRLQRARQLLLETNHSIVQVGLMCGFSSGSHFSTAFGTLFGNTPREERQRKLAAA